METIVIVSVARMGVKYLKNINSEMVSDYASSILLLVMILTFDHLNGNCLSWYYIIVDKRNLSKRDQI